MEDKSKKVNDFIYKNASKETDKILERIFPQIRQALLETYAKGFNDAATLALKHNNKNDGQ